MPLRLLEIIIPGSNHNNIRDLLEDESVIGFWQKESSENGLLVKMLLTAEDTEKILDLLEQKYSGTDGFRVVLLPVEATIPRIEETKNGETESKISDKNEKNENNVLRISREELYTDIVDNTKLTVTYMAMVALSAIVAAVGLLQDNVAIVIGAMVIAPLLGPNVALALATTLGDFELGLNSLKTNLAGVVIALILAISIGYFFTVDPHTPQIASRISVGLSDIVLALASGSAGVIAVTSGASMALIGVMVAVALIPPLIAFGLLVGSGNPPDALGALLLFVTNFICINLAGVTTFLVQGIRPRKWWEASKAKRATRFAISLWTLLLIILITVIIYSRQS